MKVSVALPTYNGEEYLEEQLESILNQTKVPDEIVIRDDCSGDGTCSILREYEDKYPEIIDFQRNKENLGVKDNFEKCISQCSGDLIAPSDQDDIWKEDKIQKLVRLFQDNRELDFAFHNTRIVSKELEEKDTYWDRYPEDIRGIESNEDLLEHLLWFNFIQGCSMIFTDKFKDKVFPIDSELTYDHHIAMNSALKANFRQFDECLLCYRQHEEQDQGPPQGSGGIRYNVSRLISGIMRDENTFEKEVKKIQAARHLCTSVEVSRISEESLSKILEENKERLEYLENRKKIYSNEISFLESLRLVKGLNGAKNYQKFGNGNRSLFIDLISCVFSF
jgi:glycosyltransferase involved in cell wall biosynthesis